MLTSEELTAVAEQFGVAASQVQRDHLVSHLLGLLGEHLGGQVLFFGGTALARTHLPDGRLSEDLDLMVAANNTRTQVAEQIDALFATGLRRTVGRLEWGPSLSQVKDTQPGMLLGPAGTSVRVQLLDSSGYPAWPTEVRGLVQRYRDAPPAGLRVPTLPAFVAWKTTAWFDRQAPRDLWDLWALSRLAAIDAAALELFITLGPTGKQPPSWLFTSPPPESTWRASLDGQTRLNISAQEAAHAVATAWNAL